jgi:predicted nuclease of predicted toxin-antitoxin system
MKLLIDMNLSPRWVGVLRAAGFEAMHWSEVGPLDAPDAQIMSFARNGDFVVLTHDLDFGAILAVTKGAKPSVVQLRADNVSPEAAGAVVIAALRTASAELELGSLLTVDAGRARVRLLPLSRT